MDEFIGRLEAISDYNEAASAPSEPGPLGEVMAAADQFMRQLAKRERRKKRSA